MLVHCFHGEARLIRPGFLPVDEVPVGESSERTGAVSVSWECNIVPSKCPLLILALVQAQAPG